jgi:hypothetical protein
MYIWAHEKAEGALQVTFCIMGGRCLQVHTLLKGVNNSASGELSQVTYSTASSTEKA